MSDSVSTVTVTVKDGRSLKTDHGVFASGQQCEIMEHEYVRLRALGFVERTRPAAPPAAAEPAEPADETEGAHAAAEDAEHAASTEATEHAEPGEPPATP